MNVRHESDVSSIPFINAKGPDTRRKCKHGDIVSKILHSFVVFPLTPYLMVKTTISVGLSSLPASFVSDWRTEIRII